MKKARTLFALAYVAAFSSVLVTACAQGPAEPAEPDREWRCRTTWVEKSGEPVSFTAIVPADVDPQTDEVKDTEGWYRDPEKNEACISRDAPKAKVKPKTKV